MRVEGVESPLTDETDGGRPKAARLRTCIVTRDVKSVDELIRFVVGPDGSVTPDLKASLPGRGVWVSARMAAVRDAVKRRAFARGFKREVKVAIDLAEQIDALLGARAREALSLANKAGMVVTGFAKVEAALGGRVAALLHASEAARDGMDKLDRRFRAIAGEDAAIFRIFTGEQLDLALGRPNVVHAALVGGPASFACLDRIRACARYREGGLSSQPAEPRRTGGARPAAGTDEE